MNDETVRCPACRGSKVVAKLGGIMGDCNGCNGTGKIKLVDKPVASVAVPDVDSVAVIEAVDKVVVEEVVIKEPVVKVDSKRVIYKRKAG